jgi:plasmid stabilization system protein ParE
MRVLITAEAEADLEAIGDYIARDTPVRALSFVRELYQLCLNIADMPQAGRWCRVTNITASVAGCMVSGVPITR